MGIVDPEKRAEAYPHQLSGGMAQRVIIAMALVAEPRVILADDATLGLDATIQVQVLDLLVASCREAGMGAVIITHDLGIVARYCDRVAIMRDARDPSALIEAESALSQRQADLDSLRAQRAALLLKLEGLDEYEARRPRTVTPSARRCSQVCRSRNCGSAVLTVWGTHAPWPAATVRCATGRWVTPTCPRSAGPR